MRNGAYNFFNARPTNRVSDIFPQCYFRLTERIIQDLNFSPVSMLPDMITNPFLDQVPSGQTPEIHWK
jgi:hypothetical protein